MVKVPDSRLREVLDRADAAIAPVIDKVRRMNLSTLLADLTAEGFDIRFRAPGELTGGFGAVVVRVSLGDCHVERCISRLQLDQSNLDLFCFEIDRAASRLREHVKSHDQSEGSAGVSGAV